MATHRLSPQGANRTVRLLEHTRALENVVLASFSTDRRCPTKVDRPPSETALGIAAEITGGLPGGDDPIIDLAKYQRIVDSHREGT